MHTQLHTPSGRKADLVALVSSISLLLVVWCAFETFAGVVFLWPALKLIGYGTIFFLLVTLSGRQYVGKPSRFIMGVEIVAALALLSLAQYISVQHMPRGLLDPARLDIATTVESAIQTLFVFHENPYNPSDPARWSGFQGVAYPYGPTMILGYLPALYSHTWFKICSIVYLVGILLLATRFVVQRVEGAMPKLASAVFVIAVILMPRTILNDVSEGINDHFPVFLLLLSLTMWKAKKDVWAGVFAGLSVSAKFSPAFFLIALFVRRELPLRFFVGVAIGCIPMFGFIIWEPARFFNDVVLFHFVKSGTPTSIFTLLPPELHNVVRALRWVCLGVFVVRNFDKKPELYSVMYEFTLLMIIMNSLHVEMHANHMFWIVPTTAILLTHYRYRAWSLGRGILGRVDASC